MARSDAILPAEPSATVPNIRTLTLADIREALRLGWDDFWAMPTHVIFLCAIYPITGLVLFGVVFGYELIPLLFPLAAGFALIGPFAAIGLYELSRRRELGRDTSLRHAADIFQSPSLGPILMLGLALLILFAAWIAAAHWVYLAHFGDNAVQSPVAFFQQVLTTPEGHSMILAGGFIGFLFALLAASISVTAFPLLLDRNVGFWVAVTTSVKSVLVNPVPMAVWFLIVAASLALGTLPLFVGLAIVLPVLGHSTWHLYRRTIASETEDLRA